MTQCDLYEKSLDQKFWEYNFANPQVLAGFVRYTRELKAAGRTRIGAKAVMERIRWDSWISADDEAGFKVNNNYTSRYARLVAKLYPDLASMFSTRKLKQ